MNIEERSYSDRISLSLSLKIDCNLHSLNIIDQLDHLEGIKEASVTKKERQFKGCLFPFWHKHYFTPKDMAKNISIRWGFEFGGNRDLDTMIEEISSKYGHDENLWPKYLAHALTVEAYNARVKRGLTGDWIIYAKHEGLNYYLDIARHEDAIGERAKNILKKLRKSSYWEFPFLFDH